MARDSYLRRIVGDDTVTQLRHTKVLMVGAGGIGCELIKDLMLLGYGEIHIVDLDTITLSNLNRQFLFRQKDIDKSKAITISQAVQLFNYHDTILQPHHGNIMDTTQFPMQWWQQFSMVFNALDNIEARRYVNKMCLFLKKPLMELGTEGYNGHVQPIYPNATECFDCDTKETPKTFPVCTIRLTPSQPVHCITWAKEFLWPLLFGEDQEQENLLGATDNEEELLALNQGTNELYKLKLARLEPQFYNELVQTLYNTDIEQLLRIDALWKLRKRPVPLEAWKHSDEISAQGADMLTNDTELWLVAQNLYVLGEATKRLQQRISGGEDIIYFDKDDEDTLNFVAAAANLRSSVFGIPLKTKFDIKEIAGNIIPAIATTNAIISGLECLGGTQFFEYVSTTDDGSTIAQGLSDYSKVSQLLKVAFISITPTNFLLAGKPFPPKPTCPSLGTARGLLKLTTSDYHDKTLLWLVEQLTHYGYKMDALLLMIGSKLLYDMDFEDKLDDPLDLLPDFKLGHVLLIQDDDDELENLELYVSIGTASTEFHQVVLGEKKEVEKPLPSGDTIIIDENEDELVLMEEEHPLKKRRVDVARVDVAEVADVSILE